MKHKSVLSLACAVGMLALAGHSNAALLLTNGNFSNLAIPPLSHNIDGAPGWYDGVPTGWTGLSTYYTIKDTGSGVYANVSTLAFGGQFKQTVGTVDSGFGDVTLTFDLNPAVFAGTLSAGIFQTGNPTALAEGTFSTVGTKQLTALNVTAGTSITIAFWSVATTPALTNVSVSAVPEPSTWALLAIGLTVVLTLRRRRNCLES